MTKRPYYLNRKLKGTHIRVDPQFKEILKKTAIDRIKVGKDEKIRSTRRLTLALSRHPLLNQIQNDIVNADLEGE